jgi:hypothetical protein
MNTKLRMTNAFWDALQADLHRPHAFAAERVAFAFGRRGAALGGDVILLSTFTPVEDGDYEDDPYVGARIGAQAIHTGLKQAALQRAAAFHVHLHEHNGMPWFSRTDLRELPPVMDPFQHIVREQPRGLLLLSDDECVGLVWHPASSRPSAISDVTIVGAPMRLLRGDRP